MNESYDIKKLMITCLQLDVFDVIRTIRRILTEILGFKKYSCIVGNDSNIST